MNKTKLLTAVCCTAMLFAACEKNDEVSVTVSGSIDGHNYVDLGLSVKWATMNVGATAPEEYGNYYAWGEITTKNDYSWSTYKYSSDYKTLTKYCTNSDYGTVDNKTTLEAADDAATQNWGGNWRMPTIDEWQELIDNCDWKWTDDYNNTGKAGDIVTSKTNGNSIFLPAAGCRLSDELSGAGSDDYYWSSSLSTDYPYDALYVFFYSDRHGTSGGSRYYGRSVRPVVK
jgi:uncharacterized protein (TIGR02145 family)